MKHFCHLFMFSVALVLGTSSAHGATPLTTTLLGSNETPPNDSTATGSALVILESDNKTLDVNVTFAGLIGGPAGAAHIHCCASPGVAAIVAVNFPNFPAATSGQYVNSFDLSVAGTYNPAFITAHGGTVDSAKAAFITALKTGQTYVNIHNAVYPGGEIRGQLAPANTQTLLTTTLLGSNETPPNASTATGRALVILESDNKTLDVNGTFAGLIGGPAVAAHIHCCASPGVAAIVAVNFPNFPAATSGQYVNSFDLSLAGTYNPAFITAHGGTVDSAKAAFITALKTGQTYVNIHNAVYPGGEIRGQLAVTPTHDFNDDGKSDILWRDNTGNTAAWLMNGGTLLQAGSFGAVPLTWSVVGQRDFDGDGNYDLLWRDTSGNTAIWLLNGLSILQTGGLGNIPTTWSVVGTADFNGDGKGDILWLDNTGTVAIWLMNGLSISQAGGLGNVNTWTVAGTADFNADGKADILWYNGGNVAIWLMNGLQVLQTGSLGFVSTQWSIVGTGDFNGDGNWDILWRDAFGNVAVWLMNGLSISQAGGLGNADIYWVVAQTGDYNGDGRSDILWRNTLTGETAIWFMNGLQISSTAGVGTVPPVWTVQGTNAD